MSQTYKPDILLRIEYPINKPDKFIIKTNAKPEVVEELLVNWIQMQMGQGTDHRKPAQKDIYNITIGLRLEDDAFGTTSDTENKGFTCGIIFNIISLLNKKKGTICELS